MQLTQARLKELFDYDSEKGAFSRRVAGKSAVGSVGRSGYRQIMIDGRQYYAHRLAWLFVNGEWPENQIDHINGLRDDNRISNLRGATASENQQNTGRVSVCWNSQAEKWQASIRRGGTRTYLGIFRDRADAVAAYLAAKARMHAFQPIPRGMA